MPGLSSTAGRAVRDCIALMHLKGVMVNPHQHRFEGKTVSNNLFIAYDLMSPGQNYDRVREAIESLGTFWQFQFSLYYVHTSLRAADAFALVSGAMDSNDRLAVIIADGGIVTNWDHPPISEINTIWHQS